MCCLTLTNIQLKAAVKMPFVILSFLRCVPYSSVNKTCHWRVHELGGNPTNEGCRTPLEGAIGEVSEAPLYRRLQDRAVWGCPLTTTLLPSFCQDLPVQMLQEHDKS